MAIEHDTRALLSRVLAAVGVTLVLPACGSRVVTDGASEGESGNATESSSSSTTETSGANETTASTDTDTDTSGTSDTTDTTDSESSDTSMILDVGGTTDPSECGEWLPQWFEIADAEIPPDCVDAMVNQSIVCFVPPDGYACDDPVFAPECFGTGLCGETLTCGPTVIDGNCCYVQNGDCPPGRGLLVAGEPISTTRTNDPSWAQSERPNLDDLDRETRATLADVWASDGLAEHVSIASFARFAAQLLALGAPPQLVAASMRASVDEVRHAQRCLGLASFYAGQPIGPGPLELRADFTKSDVDLHTAALDLAIEGCIIETISTVLLAAARDRARDPAVRAILSEIVRDEEDHVVLAWQSLAWMVGRAGPELRQTLLATFERAESWVRCEPIERPGDPERLRTHGYLSTRERRAIALDVIARLVLPAARALLDCQTRNVTMPNYRSMTPGRILA